MRYFPYQQLNGILHFLFLENNNDNSYLFTKSDSIYDSTATEDKAFDFEGSTYWTSGQTAGPAWIYFCFYNYYIKITEFEIHTTTGECRPSKFQFGFLDLNGSYVFKDFQVNAEKGAIIHEQYQAPIFSKCFKYISTESTCPSGAKRTDIVQFELFGSLMYDSELFNQRCTYQDIYLKLNPVILFFLIFYF